MRRDTKLIINIDSELIRFTLRGFSERSWLEHLKLLFFEGLVVFRSLSHSIALHLKLSFFEVLVIFGCLDHSFALLYYIFSDLQLLIDILNFIIDFKICIDKSLDLSWGDLGGLEFLSGLFVHVLELFDDEAPAACSRFARACEGGDVEAVFRDTVDVNDDLRVVLNVKAAPGGGALAEEGTLTHAAAGVVGVDRSSGDVSILTEACESLDASHQVIGRVVSGLDFLRALTHRGKGEEKAKSVKLEAMGVVRGGAPAG